MPWAKLDDSIWRNEKLLEVTPAARWLYVAAIAFCRSEETAGEISKHRMAFLIGSQGLRASHAAELVKAGLFDDTDHIFAVHDYEKFNPLTSTERVRKHRRNASGALPETPDETPEARSPHAGAGAIAGVHRVSPIPEPVSRKGDLSPKATSDPTLPFVARIEEVFGRVLSAKEREKVAGWPAKYEHVSPVRMVEIVQATVDKFRAAGKALMVLDYCHGQLADENEEACDAAQAHGGKAPRFGLSRLSEFLPLVVNR